MRMSGRNYMNRFKMSISACPIRVYGLGILLLLTACGGNKKNPNEPSALSELEILAQQARASLPDEDGNPHTTDTNGVRSGGERSITVAVVGSDKVKGFYAYSGESITLKLRGNGSDKITLYDVDRAAVLRTWRVNGTVNENVPVVHNGIYAIESVPGKEDSHGHYSVTINKPKETFRPHITMNVNNCKAGDFMARKSDDLKVVNIFSEPRKIGLRGNLKSAFSGKSRGVITIPIPQNADVVLYSLRVSNNEKTIEQDGKLANNVNGAYKKVKILGLPVWSSQSNSNIGRLLFNARPPREDDAFCNMFVLNGEKNVRKFQDTQKNSGFFDYDVSQSQIGIQSCAGQLKTNGRKTIFLGFENERMRYDTYIWLEAVALIHTVSYSRPVFSRR